MESRQRSPSDSECDLLSSAQVAQMLGRSTDRVRQLAVTGQLTYVATPLGRLFSRSSVEQFLSSRQKETSD